MLQIENLSKTFANGVRALDGVHLEVDQGLFGLLGPNGAGKSTLMRALATLQVPDTGSILLDGRDVLADPERHRRRLGYLPQEFGVYPGVSADVLLDHIALLKGLTDRRTRREQVGALLERTHLYAHRKKAVSSFSGGMRRRFGIAQALLGEPRLVIVDEPTAGLDPEERHRFHDLLVEMGENVIVLLSTHIVEDVRRLCARMAVLDQGRLLLEGDPTALVADLEGKIWSRTVGREEVQGYREEHAVLSTQLDSGRTQIRVLAEQCPDGGFESMPADLEDVYFSVLGGLEPA